MDCPFPRRKRWPAISARFASSILEAASDGFDPTRNHPRTLRHNYMKPANDQQSLIVSGEVETRTEPIRFPGVSSTRATWVLSRKRDKPETTF